MSALSSELSMFVLLRYATIALAVMIAARSAFRILGRSVQTEALVSTVRKLGASGNYARMAKLCGAADTAPLLRLIAKALSLRIPTVGAPEAQGGHFRDGGGPGEPFELAWKRAMDGAEDALRREVRVDLAAAVVALLIAALTALVGALSTADPASRLRNGTVAAVSLAAALGTARSASRTLSGLTLVRAFCEELREPMERMSEDRREAAKIAEGIWRRHAPGTDDDG